jgi:hypothetical protein
VREAGEGGTKFFLIDYGMNPRPLLACRPYAQNSYFLNFNR